MTPRFSYQALPEALHVRVRPSSAAHPELVQLNDGLARELGLDPVWLRSAAGLEVLAGRTPAPGLEPLAMAYAGHQFGRFVPRLGDGRAILIAELAGKDGRLRDLHLKGAGQTPFSRGGDGRAGLGPVVREYVVSEAMAALGVATTRSLAMLTSGERIERQNGPEPGALLVRVALGHVRVGSFEYAARLGASDGSDTVLRALADHVCGRLAIDPEDTGAAKYRTLLGRVIEMQAELVASWMHLGFIHGVMNTDNCSISGETIDYGPCAFMDAYHPNTVFSSIDHHGRYAYDQQPGIAYWNLARFAETLLPLLAPAPSERAAGRPDRVAGNPERAAEDGERAVEDGERVADDGEALEIARDALGRYPEQFQAAYLTGMRRKLGCPDAEPVDSKADSELVEELLACMAEQRADFTLTFRGLTRLSDADAQSLESLVALFPDARRFLAWLDRWKARVSRHGYDETRRRREMCRANPVFIPRNHRVAQVIDALVDHRDRAPLDRLLRVLERPFEEQPEHAEYAAPPEPHEVVHQTFCGT